MTEKKPAAAPPIPAPPPPPPVLPDPTETFERGHPIPPERKTR